MFAAFTLYFTDFVTVAAVAAYGAGIFAGTKLTLNRLSKGSGSKASAEDILNRYKLNESERAVRDVLAPE